MIWVLIERTLRKDGDPKVTKQHLVAPPQQEVLWLDIPVDHPLVMGKLQGVSHLPGIGNNHWQRQESSPGIALPKGAKRSKVHHEERSMNFNAKIQDAYDIG